MVFQRMSVMGGKRTPCDWRQAMTRKRLVLVAAALVALILVVWVGFRIAANIGFGYALP